ncbi:PP2C family protein-serine/threonine phosphatase [Jiella mangrovi]|uniref:Fused response regulator/phosphatase n=1 Tax=Jiella mangrovi TaxID=2821407 RepID=A0ABS4BID1_9HYPH|nr:fused response regulator/phosphatase [Jiella mangrovi]MBP0616495.1 fused response regulator/phosphatase [Jiella mangrovi]
MTTIVERNSFGEADRAAAPAAMRIVVADDDASQRHYQSALLRRMGYEPLVAENGGRALELLQGSDAAMMICDVDMPEMDGMTLARRVRALALGRYVYVLMITGHHSREDRLAGMEAGADDFMSKPVDASILALRVKAAERIIRYEAELQASRRGLQIAYETIRADIEAAAKAQRQLMPRERAHISSCRFSSRFLPSSEVSGDVFGYFPLGGDALGFYAADVCGHGVRAALSAVALAHLVTPEYFANNVFANDPQDPVSICTARLVAALDQRFLEASDDDSYFTFFGGILLEASDRMHFCQAGYPSPLLIRADGRTEWLGEGGMPVGMLPGASFDCQEVTFRPRDRLFVYSDGVVEAESPSGEPFGLDRLAAFVAKAPVSRSDALLDGLAARLRQWTASDLFEDDVSMILMEREGY